MASNLDSWNGFVDEPHIPTAQPILTKAFIEADYTCMMSQDIISYLEPIWEYSSIPTFVPAIPMEVAAGHRYWLPNGLLAEEWMMLFIFVPRLYDLAPPEVRTAFEKQVYNVAGHWPSFAEIMERGNHASMPLDMFSATQMAGNSFQYGYSQPGGARFAGPETASLITDPLPIPSSGFGPLSFAQSFTAPANLGVQQSSSLTITPQPLQLIQPFQPSQPSQQIPQGNLQLPVASTTGPQPGTSTAPSVSSFPLQSVPDGTAASEQNPAAPPIFTQLLQARGITAPGFRPGSRTPTDNGNKAWSAERIRAFVEIQNKSIQELPSSAFSELGTEMSNFRTPESIDVTCCPFETSLEENFTNYAHDLQTPGIFGRSKIGHHFAKAKNWGESHPGHVPTASLRHTSTDSGARGSSKDLHDYFLYSMGDGVVRPPRGRKAQMLTLVIEHVRGITNDRNVRLSQAATYAQRYNITVPAHHQMNFQNLAFEDQLPSEAFLNIIRNDYRTKFNGQDP
ncbi:hypothetical protein AA0111_g8402 [Alternaria arborescens]|uniref:hypothetical protein n=1 Tax=Alternaria arborescens TaxID=156630 RepID=UPI00107538BA|nr:hypothetical protein AA0111_g8402 [Alternaria arborescens]RYO26037.1 hypothetical protein AA0111_g8402 [Alternaria arborescens]